MINRMHYFMSLLSAEATDLPNTLSTGRVLRQAGRYASTEIEPEHLLLALLDDRKNLASRTLQALQIDTAQLRAALEMQIGNPPSGGAARPMSHAAREVVAAAMREARHLGHYQLDSIHLLLGLLYESQSSTARFLEDHGVLLYNVRQQILNGPKRWRGPGALFYLNRARAAIQVSPVFYVPLVLFLGCGLALWFDPPENYIRPLTMLFVTCGWVVSLCLHEFGHALAAFFGGDESMRASGYLTLNPLRYANPIFSLVLPILFMIAGGLGLPGGAVYVNLAALRSLRWQRIVSAAGPFATAIFGLLVAVPFWLPWEEWWLSGSNVAFWPALALLGFLQVSALLFNLLPIPPLDGFGMIAPSLPPNLRAQLRAISGLAMMVMFTLLWNNNPVSAAFWRAVFDATDAIGVPVWLVGLGFDQFQGN
jgi:Zn-dependent protease